MSQEIDNTNSPTSKLFILDNILRVTGFIADMIAIISVLIAINTPNPGQFLSNIISPWFAVMIWVLALYTYICYLHNYWGKSIQINRWSKKFAAFLIIDLLAKFRKPVLLFPALFLLIIFFSIFYVARMLGDLLGIIGLVAFGGTIIGIILDLEFKWVGKFKDRFLTTTDAEQIEEFKLLKESVESMWTDLKPVIKRKLSKKSWIHPSDFKEYVLVWELNDEALVYSFAKYAAEESEEAFFGNVYYSYGEGARLGGTPVAQHVLVNTSLLDSSKYGYK